MTGAAFVLTRELGFCDLQPSPENLQQNAAEHVAE
jgi:hypothetical protein